MTAPDLETLKSRMHAARKALDAATADYHAALCAAHPFQRGDIIQAQDGTRARVEGVFIKFGSARVHAVLRKADGNWGQRQPPMWHRNWESPVKVGHEELVP